MQGMGEPWVGTQGELGSNPSLAARLAVLLWTSRFPDLGLSLLSVTMKGLDV